MLIGVYDLPFRAVEIFKTNTQAFVYKSDIVEILYFIYKPNASAVDTVIFKIFNIFNEIGFYIPRCVFSYGWRRREFFMRLPRLAGVYGQIRRICC